MALSMDRLSEVNAVSGFEDEARAYLIPLIKEKCDSLEVDSMGNIIALKKGKSDKYRILLGTNIDEVGFIVSEITEKGFLKFKSVGSPDPRTLVSKRIVVGKDRIPGVIGMKAIHLQKKEEREAAVKVKDLYIDIGAKDKEDAEKSVKLGDIISFDTQCSEIGDIIKGKALDRFGTVAVFNAMDEVPAYDTYFVFSAQREISGRGMKIATFRINPDFALIVDTVNADDFPDTKSASAILGNGAVMRYKDLTSVSNVIFMKNLALMSKRNGIKTQNQTTSEGASVAGSVNSASYGAVTATVGIACRYSHTPVSYMRKDDINEVSNLCRAFVKESDVIIDGFIKETDRI